MARKKYSLGVSDFGTHRITPRRGQKVKEFDWTQYEAPKVKSEVLSGLYEAIENRQQLGRERESRRQTTLAQEQQTAIETAPTYE